MQVDHQCAHELCDCRVAQAGDYCSDACREQDRSDAAGASAVCACGHSECGASNVQASGPTG
jgi:hypothetical protein